MTSELIAKNLMSEIEARIMNVPQVTYHGVNEKVVYTVSTLANVVNSQEKCDAFVNEFAAQLSQCLVRARPCSDCGVEIPGVHHVKVKSRMPEYGYSIFFTFDNQKLQSMVTLAFRVSR